MKTYPFLMYSLILFLLAASSCEDKVIDQDFAFGREISLEVNKLYASNNGNYAVIINEVSDSRCADGAMCVWAGEVTVKGELTVVGNKSSFEIHSVVSQQNKQPEGYTVQIIDAKPYPKLGVESKPEDLIVTLLIKKN